MPGCPRADVVDPSVVGVYHVWNRCVRRAWLCGQDPLTGSDYEYRRDWIAERQALLARLFAIEIGWHAELSNHIHLILRNRPDVVETWSDEEVVRRILIINRIVRNFTGVYKEPTQLEIRLELSLLDEKTLATYRIRLAHVSFFMAALCEHLSRRINADDGLSGTLWEGRFKCRNLEDEAGLLTCGVYVDLNQIRAGEAVTPETSTHTSACDRIKRLKVERDAAAGTSASSRPSGTSPAGAWLAELTLAEGPGAEVARGLKAATPWRLTDKGMLPISLPDYLELLDWTGRQVVEGKAGSIPQHLASILERLHISSQSWFNTVTNFEKLFGQSVGRAVHVAQRVIRCGKQWIQGHKSCESAFT